MTLIGLILTKHVELFQKHKSGIVFTFSALGFLTFVAAGAAVFMVLESDDYERTQRDVLEAKARIMKKFPNVPAEALDEFLEEMRATGVRGLPKKGGKIVRWSYSDSTFFVTTLLTTVGYGHFTPKTIPGKIFCMIYTTIGIPVTLVHMASYVDALLKMSEKMKAKLFHIYQGKIAPCYIRFLHMASLMSVIVLLCFILPAAYFVSFEKDWSMFDGIYCCFISLTTVGLGDMVPTLNTDMAHPDLYKFSASIYLIVGVTIIMFMMSMCGDYYRNYRNEYQALPFVIPTEKLPINPSSTHTYGAILTLSGKSESDTKPLLKT